MPIVTLAEAVFEFNRLAQPDACPTLDTDEQTDILNRHQRGSVWTAATAYDLGAIVIPTISNRVGVRFKCIDFLTAGSDRKTGATEPTWSTSRDARYSDGNVTWQEDGWDWNAVLWDLRGAAEEAWTIKANKSIGRVDFAPAQGLSVSASQLYDHCIAQADRFRSVYLL